MSKEQELLDLFRISIKIVKRQEKETLKLKNLIYRLHYNNYDDLTRKEKLFLNTIISEIDNNF